MILFLNELGIKHYPDVSECELTWQEMRDHNELPKEYSTGGHRCFETRIDGCIELAKYIASNMVAEKSYLLWNSLVRIFEREGNISSEGKYKYYYYSPHYKFYKSLMAQALQEEKWLIDKDGNYVNASAIRVSDLAADYDISSEGTQKLIEFLGFIEEKTEEPLTEEEKLASMCKKYGIENEEDFREFQEWKKQVKNIRFKVNQYCIYLLSKNSV